MTLQIQMRVYIIVPHIKVTNCSIRRSIGKYASICFNCIFISECAVKINTNYFN